ncbi:leucine-rich repeat protein (LRRP) [Trypanosoma rangeli]|uniref:Leucine-rich repeat protein (LRRP) n=1 Tax=Trypanosoma rangeli TaxID=5698 RepID=A0A3R7KT01_TRYRA|nr:leucine-rich repeat protein (LRRP) [Trypanosoma rangeli]RNF09077.1 leucine-rich repeat protein (LRRP) [Trypanosoma rangeli]|eukprot:RNF09077.1 leucine-rich repeat protein (LRRP) [Trypanosoma rangeli]
MCAGKLQRLFARLLVTPAFTVLVRASSSFFGGVLLLPHEGIEKRFCCCFSLSSRLQPGRMPVETVAVDVPTAVCEKTATHGPRGPCASGGDDLCAIPRTERLLQAIGENSDGEVELFQGAHARGAAAAEAGMPHSSQSSGSNGGRVLPPRTRPLNGAEPPTLNADTCVILPSPSLKGVVDFSGWQLTVLPCVHDMAAKSKHNSGSKAASQARMLQLSHNCITSLIATPASATRVQPIALANFTKLVMLDVSRNELTSLDGVEKMKSLRVLQASHNKIVDLEPLFRPDSSLQRSATLRVLDVSFNQIHTLLPSSSDTADSSLHCLHTLMLSYNRLTQLGDLERLFPDVLELRIIRNQLTEPPQSLPKRISRLELQQNYLDEDAQTRMRELQRRMRYLREVELGEQRTRQEVASETDNTTAGEGIQDSGSEEDVTEDGEVHHAVDDDDASEAESRDTVDATTLPCMEEEEEEEDGQGGDAGQISLREVGAQPPGPRVPSHNTFVDPAVPVRLQDLRWLENAQREVTAMLASVFATAALQASYCVSHVRVQPRVNKTELTRVLSLIHEFYCGTEPTVPCMPLCLGDTKRDGVVQAGATLAALLTLTGKPPCLSLTQSTTEPQETVEEVGVVEHDVDGKENALPQQRQRGNLHTLEERALCPTPASLFMPKGNLFTRGTCGREWLIGELKAPLNWSQTSQCHGLCGSYLMRRTRQERIDRRRKPPEVSNAPQDGKVNCERIVL